MINTFILIARTKRKSALATIGHHPVDDGFSIKGLPIKKVYKIERFF